MSIAVSQVYGYKKNPVQTSEINLPDGVQTEVPSKQ